MEGYKNKKYLHELERHISILTAPNYNINLILKDSITGHNTNKLINQSDTEYDKSNKSKKSNNSRCIENLTRNINLTSDFSFKNSNSKTEDKSNKKNSISKRKKNVVRSNNSLFSISKNNEYSLDYDIYSVNLRKLKRTLIKESAVLQNLTDDSDKVTNGINQKINSVALEKIEIIEEKESMEAEIENLGKMKNEFMRMTSTGSNEDPSTREMSKGSNNSPFNTAPNQSIIDPIKLKKALELKQMLENLTNSISNAKDKVKEKKEANKMLLVCNKDLKAKEENKSNIIKQLQNEIDFMKKKLDEKKGNSTASKLIEGFKSIFKKK